MLSPRALVMRIPARANFTAKNNKLFTEYYNGILKCAYMAMYVAYIGTY